MAEGTDLLAAATNIAAVLPRRVVRQVRPLPGRLDQAHALLTDPSLAAGGLDDQGEARVLELERTLRTTSICGLGQVALGPVASVLGMQRDATRSSRNGQQT